MGQQNCNLLYACTSVTKLLYCNRTVQAYSTVVCEPYADLSLLTADRSIECNM